MSGSGRILPLIFLLLAGCGRWSPGEYTGGEGPTGGTRADGGTPDGGGDDGGKEVACPVDPDGVNAFTGLAIAEVAPGTHGWLELVNLSDSAVDLSDWSVAFADGSLVKPLQGTLGSGARMLVPAAIPATGEAALQFDGSLEQYVCWGNLAPSTTQNVALSQGLWPFSGVCTTAPAAGRSLHLRGAGTAPTDWTPGVPSPLGCEEE